MMRPSMSLTGRTRFVLPVAALLASALSCKENLPSGPDTFPVTIKIGVSHDTIVVGDSSIVQAVATDGSGRTIQSLSFAWTSADSTIVGFATPAPTPDGSSGRTRTLVGRRGGRSIVTLALPDSRFAVANAPRTETVVVGGVRVLSTRDSTLTAVNDTGFAIAAGLVHVNGALVTKVSQGIRWIHHGAHTTVVGAGDTVRYIARSNGADTLIATHDFCLISAKCADTAVIHVSQQLTMTLSVHSLLAWSFSDSLAPIVKIADRRGNGLAGTSVRFIPVAAADSAKVRVTPTLGTSDVSTGVVASPRLVSTNNGAAHVNVIGLAPDGSIVGSDSVIEVVRQVARRVQVEPLRAVVTTIDSVPYRLLARDARGAVIGDATVSVSATGTTLHSVFLGPNPSTSALTQATVTPTLTGKTLPDSNPLAPQVPVIVDPAVISLVHLDTVKAGATAIAATMTVADSTTNAAVGAWVRFATSAGPIPDSVQVGGSGNATVVWTPPNIAQAYTLTGTVGTPAAPLISPDSSVRTVLRRSVVVIAADPSATKTTVAISATTIATNATATVTVVVKDQFGNVVTTATPAAFTIVATRGAITGTACTLGTCTATYTAPATTGADSLSVKILGIEVLLSPIAITIN
jgi:hypothetical protein